MSMHILHMDAYVTDKIYMHSSLCWCSMAWDSDAIILSHPIRQLSRLWVSECPGQPAHKKAESKKSLPQSLCTVSKGPSLRLWLSRKLSDSDLLLAGYKPKRIAGCISFINKQAVIVFSKSNTWIQKSNTLILEFKRYLNLSKLIMIVIIKQYPKFDVINLLLIHKYLVHYFVLYFRVVTGTSDPFFDPFWLKRLNTLNNKLLYLCFRWFK